MILNFVGSDSENFCSLTYDVTYLL